MLDEKTKTFLTAARELNFTRTAKILCMTQPGVSQHIRQLENHYGVKLFSLIGKKQSLTTEGIILRDALEKLRGEETDLENRLKNIGSSKCAENIRIGATLTVGGFMIAPYIARYKKKFPHAQISLSVANTNHLLQDLRQGKLDFAIVEGNFPRREFERILFKNEAFIAVAPCKKNIPTRTNGWKDLLDFCLLTREKGSGTRHILESILLEEGLSVDDFANVMEIGSMTAMVDLAAEGAGITAVYESAVHEKIKQGSLREIHMPIPHSHEINIIRIKNNLFDKDRSQVILELFEV